MSEVDSLAKLLLWSHRPTYVQSIGRRTEPHEIIGRAKGADLRIKELRVKRRAAYAGVFEAIVDEQQGLRALYQTVSQRMHADAGSMVRSGLSIRRIVDLESWVKV